VVTVSVISVGAGGDAAVPGIWPLGLMVVQSNTFSFCILVREIRTQIETVVEGRILLKMILVKYKCVAYNECDSGTRS